MAAKLGTLTLDLVAKTGSYTEGMKQAGDSTKKFSAQSKSELDKLNSSISNVERRAGAMGALLKTTLAGLTVGVIISAADEYTQMAAQIRNATKDTAEYDLVQKHLLSTANTTYRSLKEAQQVYLDVGGALKAYGATTEQALRITDSLSFSFTHNSTAVDKAKTATDAYLKSVYSGKVGQQQWISILSAIPSVVSDLSDSLGISQEEVLRLGNAGKISSLQLNDAFDSSRDKSEQLANNMSNSLNDGLNTARNGFTFLTGRINETLGVTNNMAAGLGLVGDGLSYAANNLDVVAVAAGVVTAGIALKMTPAVIASGVAFTASTGQAIAYQLALARMSAQAAGTTVSLTVLSAAARGALVFMTGPAGLVIAAASVAAGYAFMTNRAADLNAKLAEQAMVAEKAASELSKLTGTERKSAIEDLTAAFDAQNKELRKSELAVGSALISVQNYAKGNAEVTKISNQARLGTISYTEAVERLNSLNIPTDLYNALKAQVEQYDKNVIAADKSSKALKIFGIEVQLVGNKAQNSVAGIDANTSALNRNEAAARGAAVTQSQYMESLKQSLIQTQTINKLIDKGYNVDRAKALAEAYFKNDGAITSEDVKLIDANIAANAKLQGTIDAIAESKRKSTAASKDAASQTKKDAKDAERLADQQMMLRKSLVYEFSTDLEKMKIDYEDLIKDIGEASFSPALRNQFLSESKARFEDEQALYKMKLSFELQEHKLNEEAKAEATFIIDQQIIANRTDINTDEKKQYLTALQEKHTHAMRWLQLEQNMRLNDASQAFQTEMQNMSAKYEFERQQIILNSQLSKDERQALVDASHITESIDSAKGRDAALYGMLGASGVDTSQEEAASQRAEAFQAALDWQLITQEEYQQKMLESESQYYRAKAALGLQDAANTTAGMADLMGSLLGKQSAGYKAMFIASKMFALSKVILNAPETFSNVYNSVSAIPMIGPYIAPVVAGGALAVQLGQAAQIRSMNLQGFATGGHITGKGTGTSDDIPIWASNGEYMLRAAAVEKLGLANLDYINRTGMLPPRFATGGLIGKERFLSTSSQSDRRGDGVNIIINVPSGYTANESRDGNGNVTIDVVEKFVKQAFSNLNQANSFESKQIRNNFNVGRVR
ncbi:tape measure protein [Acinetobacter sp. NIPH 1852]|uniref:tape measure protein n=1 Tax=Acinetobacter sp. NIPH 1852 TaxID=2923428 RepID=UPI001F4AE509|nr:tape measure protein [Acinetobacter sp. NIPH 1852]MCH7307562.1 tape measure protein [Acinetobacter sp. NIPH 1852]